MPLFSKTGTPCLMSLPLHELCLAAVREDGMALKHVPEQTPILCMATVVQDAEALR